MDTWRRYAWEAAASRRCRRTCSAAEAEEEEGGERAESADCFTSSSSSSSSSSMASSSMKGDEAVDFFCSLLFPSPPFARPLVSLAFFSLAFLPPPARAFCIICLPSSLVVDSICSSICACGSMPASMSCSWAVKRRTLRLASFRRWQCQHVARSSLNVRSNRMGWYTGRVREMWPRCPRQLDCAWPQLLQRSCGSRGPIRSSYNPPGTDWWRLSKVCELLSWHTLRDSSSSLLYSPNDTPTTC